MRVLSITRERLEKAKRDYPEIAEVLERMATRRVKLEEALGIDLIVAEPAQEPSKPPDVPTAPAPVDEPRGSLATIWPAYDAPAFFQHGNAQENTYREAAIAACRAAGLDCIRVTCPNAPNDELGMHLLKMEHPDRPGYFLSTSWYEQARAKGVTRWVLDLGDGHDAAKWKRLLKAYSGEELQTVVGGRVVTL